MIGCEKARELISCLIDGELSEKEQSEVLAHIEICPECRAVYDAFSAVSESLSELEEVPEGFSENVMGAIKAPPAKHKTPWVKYLSLAACLALVIFAGTKLNVSKSNDNTASEIVENSGQVVRDESVLAESEPADDCGEAPGDNTAAASEAQRADCEPAANDEACDSFNTYAATNDLAVVLIRSDGACATPDDEFISRLETETKGAVNDEKMVRKAAANSTETKEKTVAEPDYTLSLQDGTEYKIFVSGDAVTVHCGERIYTPDLSAEDIEKLFE